MRVHRLRILDVVGERNLLGVKFLRRLARENHLLRNQRRDELVEVTCDLVRVRIHINAADVLQNLRLLHRRPRDPPHKHLGVLEHLVIAFNALQHIGELPVLAHKRIL